ncbi:hypothetical protein [Cupriavidus agavae]|uniref:Chromosome partition protein Smc n=1 Tax=Cupriavidus agavae TaxID=1001822 RepID=A0A4Q7RRH4_9BURK|nr:hypothetical protein [Cupriavidus agavae]RZT35398.1 hypothetical protein EV147_3834 [Cupriavidus agavae]
MTKKGNEDDKAKFDLVQPSASGSLRELAVRELGEFIDSAAIGRIVQAAQEIELSRRRILSEHTAIGSRIFQIYHTILTCCQKRFGEERAQGEADRLLYAFASRVLHISRGSAVKYLQAFHHFSDNADAITFLNLGELTILKRADITEDEIHRFIEARKADETYSRKDILPYIEWSRKTHQELNSVMATLQAAEDQLNESLERQRDLEAQMKAMREQANASDAQKMAQKEQLDRSTAALSSQANTVESLQVLVSRLTVEKNALQKSLAESKIREVVREVKVDVIPPEYKSVADAVIDANRQLDEAKAQLREAQQQLGELNVQIQGHESKAADSRSTSLRIDGLCADLDDALNKLRATIKSIKKKEHGPALLSLRRTVETFHNELIGLTGA